MVTGETAWQNRLRHKHHQQFAKAVGQAFSLPTLLPRASY